MNGARRGEGGLRLPDFTLLSASAGCGKTTELTKRLLTLLLSETIPHNGLRNILAVTFTNNAASEMKSRVLDALKRAAFGDGEAVARLVAALGEGEETVSLRAGAMVDHILDHYSDLQVQTIDSFLSRILRVATLDLGLPPGFEIILDDRPLLIEAFALFLNDLVADPAKRPLLDELTALLSDSWEDRNRFLWNPFDDLRRQVESIYKRLHAEKGMPAPLLPPGAAEVAKEELKTIAASIDEVTASTGVTLKVHFAKIVELARAGDAAALIGRKLDQDPVKQSGRSEEAKERIAPIQEGLARAVGEYVRTRAYTYYDPYIRAYESLLAVLDGVRKRRAQIGLGDGMRLLARSLAHEAVPEIYFLLGERIHHFLIDEFQDTSPIQWETLRPLIENSLAAEGSLFIVGDTKQSIYSFRGGDWQIMKRMLGAHEFPSVATRIGELTTNYRSEGAIVEAVRRVFHESVREAENPAVAGLSGLLDFDQSVPPGREQRGFVEIARIERRGEEEVAGANGEGGGDAALTDASSPDALSPDAPSPAPPSPAAADARPERDRLLGIIADCRARGFRLRDIAVLTPANSDVVEVSRWLNEARIRFVSHSSLDVRTRRVTGEIMALLTFLDSPVDDLAFSTFLLGDIFRRTVGAERADAMQAHILAHRAESPRGESLYVRFRAEYPDLWREHFEELFALVGYLPLYDLLAQAYAVFDLFALCPEEEGSLVKILEAAAAFERSGANSLGDFLAYAGEDTDEAAWDIVVPEDEDAVTVMTVHKAKGLGFPLLIVLLPDKKGNPENLFLKSSPDGVRLVHITSGWAKCSPELAEIYESKRDLALIDELNKLYVALTRAHEEMYVLSIPSERTPRPSRYLAPAAIGAPTPARERPRAEGKRAQILHSGTRGLAPSKNADPINVAETLRGEYLHAVLARITVCDGDPRAAVAAAIAGVPLPPGLRDGRIDGVLERFLGRADVRPYFKTGLDILNEQEIVARTGRLYRVDRLMTAGSVTTVLDYKTGAERPEYDEQVREYMALLREMRPAHEVRGVLAYVDLGILRSVA